MLKANMGWASIVSSTDLGVTFVYVGLLQPELQFQPLQCCFNLLGFTFCVMMMNNLQYCCNCC